MGPWVFLSKEREFIEKGEYLDLWPEVFSCFCQLVGRADVKPFLGRDMTIDGRDLDEISDEVSHVIHLPSRMIDQSQIVLRETVASSRRKRTLRSLRLLHKIHYHLSLTKDSSTIPFRKHRWITEVMECDNRAIPFPEERIQILEGEFEEIISCDDEKILIQMRFL